MTIDNDLVIQYRLYIWITNLILISLKEFLHEEGKDKNTHYTTYVPKRRVE